MYFIFNKFDYVFHFVLFSPRHGSAAPARRLWNFLVRQEFVQDLFIRSIFSRQPRAAGSSTLPTMNQEIKSCSGSETPNSHLPDPVRIIHKEQDSISAFCLNLVFIIIILLKYLKTQIYLFY